MSAQSLKLSICIPTFERAIFLDYLLKNIDEESYKLEFPFEIIISDNASNDDTSKIVEKWKSKLKLKYFRQKTNIGAVQNYNFVINQASGEFSLYLADDDILDFSSLNSCIFEFSEMPNVGVYYAPWKIGDPEGNTFTQFFSIQTGMYFQKGDYPKFLELVLKNHIFPEIGIFRTQILKSLSPIIRLDIAFNFFTIAAEWLSHSDVYMSNQCFYLSISKHPAGERTQAGFEQVEFMWDSYRGGLELFLGHFVKNISADVAARYREGINQFIAIRMSVAIRVRLINKRDRIETYFLAARLRGLGREELMPVPFQHICVNAAISYVVEYSQNKDENKNFYLLGDFEPSLVDFIEQEFAIKKVSIIKVVDINVKDSIIFFRGFPKEVKIEHFSSDESGNTYFSEHELLNIKYK